MTNKILFSAIFKQKAKRLLKKYASLAKTLKQLETDLIQNPKLGVAYGSNIYKIRIEGEGKGKSGGYRVVTYLVQQTKTETTVNVLTIFTKAEESTITKTEVLKIIKVLGL